MVVAGNLFKSYGKTLYLKDISINLKRGSALAVAGENGAGKTTLLKVLATASEPDSGTLFIDGIDALANPAAARERIGYVPQGIALMQELTVRDNLYYWMKTKDEALYKWALDAVGLEGMEKKKVSKLSGGMKRRLNIGAALLHKPELIIMDEPTVGIDPQSRNHILNTVKELSRGGATIIYTSHYMEEVEMLCSRVFIMDEGRVIAAGTTDEITASIGGQYAIKLKLGREDSKLCESLEKLDCVIAVNMEEVDISIAVKAQETSVKAVLDVIAKSGAELKSLDIEKANLETVFLNLTGRALRD